MTRRALLSSIVTLIAAATSPIGAQTPPITAMATTVAATPLLQFRPLPVDSGLPRGTWPSGLVPLPAMPAYLPHPIAAGPPRGAALAAIERVAPLPRARPPGLEIALASASEPMDLRRGTDMTAITCGNVAALGYAVAVPKPPIDGPGACDAPEVVDLAGVVLADGKRIAIDPPATLNCAMAEQVARWLREDFAAAAARVGHGVRTLRNYASYDCRGRNNNPLARMSEHGRANALDIRGFEGHDGKWMVIDAPDMPAPLLAEMKRGACERFMTVLGPGSDGFHESHIHVDLAERRSGLRMCQWVLPGTPAVAAAPTAPAGGPFATASVPRAAPPAGGAHGPPPGFGLAPLPPPRPGGL